MVEVVLLLLAVPLVVYTSTVLPMVTVETVLVILLLATAVVKMDGGGGSSIGLVVNDSVGVEIDQAYGRSNYGPAEHPEVLQRRRHRDLHLRYICHELPANNWLSLGSSK